MLSLSSTVLANTISAPTETVYNTDFVSVGVGGVRDQGYGTITLSGVSGTITKALLFWHGPTDSTDPAVNQTIKLNGSPVTGENIGFSSDNCWDYLNSQAYRADVTSLVTGNGDYSLTDLMKPGSTRPLANINGVSLVVFFDDGNSANNRDVVIYQGNDSNINNPYDGPGWNVTLSGITYSAGTANLQLHVGDGQAGDDWNDDDLVLNGVVLAPGPLVFLGSSVPDAGTAAAHNGGLWDIKSWDVTSWLTPGPNTLAMTTGVVGDCLSLVVAIFDLPAGSAPKPTVKLTVDKFYDRNTDGVREPGEPLLADWPVGVANDAIQIGPTPFSVDLQKGPYTVFELPVVEVNWVPTTATSVAVDLTSDTSIAFGNVCLGPGGGKTLGFWSNKNGQAMIGSDDLAVLVALNLRNKNGSAFDPANYASFRNWILKADAVNMAYMLSAQMTAMALNRHNGLVDGGALICASGTASANAAGFATVNAIIAEADTLLAANPLITDNGSPLRTLATALKNALDKANNNLSFVQAEPCMFSYVFNSAPTLLSPSSVTVSAPRGVCNGRGGRDPL
jgi:hypothetical protein